ncbi:hypothetical protein B0H14DRAFT_2823410 [Mycena olivaceomarginata]|nr:hypothetical protein B0H14DRAFT_2823410 [Mycena olivaceomarginata]
MSAESLNLTLESFFGPILVGGASHATLIVQSYALYERAPVVHQPWKNFVGLPLLSTIRAISQQPAALDFIRIIFLCQMAYQMFVVNWGDVLSIVGTPEPLILYLGFSGAQPCSVKGSSLVRKQLPLCGALGLASVAAFALNTVASIELRMRETTGYLMLHSGGEFLASLALRAAVDAVNNLALTRYLAVIFASGLAMKPDSVFAASSSSLAWLALHFALGGFCSNAVVTISHATPLQHPREGRWRAVRAWVATNPRPDAGGESSRRSVLSDDYPPTYKAWAGRL